MSNVPPFGREHKESPLHHEGPLQGGPRHHEGSRSPLSSRPEEPPPFSMPSRPQHEGEKSKSGSDRTRDKSDKSEGAHHHRHHGKTDKMHHGKIHHDKDERAQTKKEKDADDSDSDKKQPFTPVTAGSQSGMKSEMEAKVDVASTTPISAMTAEQGIKNVCALIETLCDRMLVGEIGGKPSVMLDLKNSAELPSAFQSATLSISQTDAGLTVTFSNFATAAIEKEATLMVMQNAKALQMLVTNLEQKNVFMHSLQIGATTIPLPAAAAVVAAQPIESASIQADTERPGYEEEGGGSDAGDEGGGK